MVETIIQAAGIFLVACYLYSRWGINPTYDWLYKRNNGNDDDSPKPPRCPNCKAERYDWLYKNKHKDDGPPSSTKCPNCGW